MEPARLMVFELPIEDHAVRNGIWLAACLGMVALLPCGTRASERELERLQKKLCGHIVDYTKHHDADRRIWSCALHDWRNIYVYLPPNFDPCRKYPVIYWLHGYAENEELVVDKVVDDFDHAIVCGKLVPSIFVIPGGRYPGRVIGSMFLNTKHGNYEDYVVQDVWEFVAANYPVHPDPQAHVLIGLSHGGWAAYNIAMRHHDQFGVVAGLIPLLNPRWVDCHGMYYRRDFDPCCWGWRNELCRNHLLGIWYGLPITLKTMVKSNFGWGDEGLAWLSKENPIELLDALDIQPDDLDMYVAYLHHDQLNVDAQIESFLYTAKCRGIPVKVDYRPQGGGHTVRAALKFLPSMIDWINCQIAPCCAAEAPVELADPPPCAARPTAVNGGPTTAAREAR